MDLVSVIMTCEKCAMMQAQKSWLQLCKCGNCLLQPAPVLNQQSSHMPNLVRHTHVIQRVTMVMMHELPVSPDQLVLSNSFAFLRCRVEGSRRGNVWQSRRSWESCLSISTPAMHD